MAREPRAFCWTSAREELRRPASEAPLNTLTTIPRTITASSVATSASTSVNPTVFLRVLVNRRLLLPCLSISRDVGDLRVRADDAADLVLHPDLDLSGVLI